MKVGTILRKAWKVSRIKILFREELKIGNVTIEKGEVFVENIDELLRITA